MRGSKKGRAELSPSLFPFLAVLLCTVGALVLILVLVVGQSQASVKEAADTRAERTAELRTQVELVRDSFEQAREEIQLEIEKKRMSLQGLEKQTAGLLNELEELQKTGKLIEKKLTDDTSSEAADEQLSELEKELQEAAQKLKSKLDKPTGDKPVFAIIPYTGNNGTHRRPIYLECRADGIVIQPEGVVIGMKDLKPPYGPGNPLDAALRTIRTRYAPQDGALHTSAYPLLVVRSSGIRTYALARMAMAGWDDQFGYELIDDEMELDFPAGEPGLAKEIEETLVAARNRQAALVMAMPGRYRRAMAELSEDEFHFDEGSEGGGWGNAGDGTGGGLGDGADASGAGLAGGPGGSPSSSGANGIEPAGQDRAAGGMSAGSGRAGFAFAPDGSGSSVDRSGSPSAGGAGGLQGFASGGNATAQGQPGKNGAALGNQPLGNQQPGTGTHAPSATPGSFAEGAFSGNRYSSAGDSSGGGAGGEAGGQLAQDAAGNAQASAANRAGTFRDAMNAARAKQDGATDSQSSQPAAGGADSGTGGSQVVSPRSEGVGSISGNGSEVNAETQLGAERTLSGRKQEHAEAVAKRKGRNWAWSAGPPRDTAFVRAIRIACYEDRWVVQAEPASGEKAHTVMLDVSLQTSAEELAKVIADRVDRWGFALAGGYWKPVLSVEVAPGGQARFEQLKRLLDGSGLEIQAAR